ncbi:hypothetical protein ACQP1G_38170 [Nocardia sp. CA-107356]|uniref:hypothetical protein n=1 Tax=Nocardia sp. CA-107356 TaxID=3239972 RepID=UPI003D9162DF
MTIVWSTLIGIGSTNVQDSCLLWSVEQALVVRLAVIVGAWARHVTVDTRRVRARTGFRYETWAR